MRLGGSVAGARRVRLLLGKDARVLSRSPTLVVALVVYPLLVALVVGLVARFAADRPRVAFVDEDGIPEELVVGGRTFDVAAVLEQAEDEVNLVRLSPQEAERRLETGDVVGILVVPPGFVSRLRGMAKSPAITLKVARGGLSERVEREAQALVYTLNRKLQDAYLEATFEYVRLIREGGKGTFLGNDFDVVGLEAARRRLAAIERAADDPALGRRARELRTFVSQALVALGKSGETLRATANPIELRTEGEGRREWLLSAQVQVDALALTVALVCALLAAVAIASERDENTISRLVRGLVRLGEIVAEKLALALIVAVALGMAVAVAFALAVELSGPGATPPWGRLPLLAAALALAGTAFGGFGVVLGVVARDGRTAALLAFLIALPLALLALLPGAAVAPAAWLSEAFPFAHAARLFRSVLYDDDPSGAIAREGVSLLVVAGVYAAAARAGMRRLLV